MPKDTFLNLPVDKKERIIKAAIDEFSDNDYRHARINEIVRAAGISKGSFYQYFEDKKDLFKYVIDIIYEKKMEAMSGILNSVEEIDIFQMLRLMAEAAIKMAQENPKLSRIGDRLLSDSSLLKEMLEDYTQSSDKFMEAIIRKGIERGDIAHWIDPSFAAKLITSFLLTLGSIVREENGGRSSEEAVKKFYSMVRIIEDGMRRRDNDDRS